MALVGSSPRHYSRVLSTADVGLRGASPRKMLHVTGILVSTIQVPGPLFIFGVLSRPWSLIVNLVADPRLRRFDSRWPQTLMCCAACAALSDRQMDLANLAIAGIWRIWRSLAIRQIDVSLKKPNKRYKVSQEVQKLRIFQVLKNVWRVRWYFLQKFDMEPMILGSDQMPVHRNESSNEKTLSFKGLMLL